MRDVERELAESGIERLWLESADVALTIASSRMRVGLGHMLLLDLRRGVHERGEREGHGGWAVFDEQGREVADHRLVCNSDQTVFSITSHT